MKTISILLLFMLIINLSSITAIDVFSGDIKPHEDPNAIKEDLDPISLLKLYILIFRGLLNIERINISNIFNLLNQAYFPVNQRYLISRINSLLNTLYYNLNATYEYVEEARLLVKYGIYEEALNMLNKAKIALFIANQSLIKLDEAYNELLYKFRPLIPGYLGGYLNTLEGELRGLTDDLEALIDEIYKLIIKLEGEAYLGYEQTKGKIKTYISIYAYPEEVKVGRSIAIYGRLYIENRSLSYKAIYIESPLASKTIYTDQNGNYNITLNVYGYYNETVRVRVFYRPYGPDNEIYISSYNYTDIKIIYIKTIVNAYIPKQVIVGKTVIIMGNITPWNESIAREVTILMDNHQLTSFITETPTFHYEYILPNDTEIGPHIISILVAPHKEYSDARTSQIVMVTYIPIHLEILHPKIVFYPIDKIILEGLAYDEYGYPLSHEYIEIYIKDQNFSLITDLNGSFKTQLSTPFHNGELRIAVRIIPREPWYMSQTRIVTVNIVNIYLLVISLVLLSSITITSLYYLIPYLRKRVKRHVKMEYASRPIMKRGRMEGGRKILSVKDGVISKLYYEITNILSKFFGAPKPEETLREYYGRIKGLISIVADKLWRLTRYVEYELYSGRKPPTEMVKDAKKIYKGIINAIKRKFKI